MIRRHGLCLTLLADIPRSATVAIAANPDNLPDTTGSLLKDQFGNFRQCWREPKTFPECVKFSGSTVSGRNCCGRVESAHNDLFNLYPAVGEVNGDRSNLKITGETREYGHCNIEIDRETRWVEPPEVVMGDIARKMFYTYTDWGRQDSPNNWEFEHNRRITAIQGRGNTFIERWGQQTPPVEVACEATEPTSFTCGEKCTCGQMESCEEARFHLEQCGLSRLDGNGDGVPCDSLCK